MTTQNLEIIPPSYTPEEIADHYAAAMVSVKLINSEKPVDIKDDEWAECLSRNKEHLRIMLARNYWTTEDLEPFRKAIV